MGENPVFTRIQQEMEKKGISSYIRNCAPIPILQIVGIARGCISMVRFFYISPCELQLRVNIQSQSKERDLAQENPDNIEELIQVRETLQRVLIPIGILLQGLEFSREIKYQTRNPELKAEEITSEVLFIAAIDQTNFW